MFKFQTKIPGRSGVCVQGEWQKYTPPSPPLSKDEGLKDIGHSISIANLILGLSNVMVWFLICWFLICYGLIFDATGFIIKRDSYFITKGDRSLLQNASGFFLQNATILLEKKWLLQIATILSQNTTVITKCDAYYKLRQYTVLQMIFPWRFSLIFSGRKIWKMHRTRDHWWKNFMSLLLLLQLNCPTNSCLSRLQLSISQ